MASDVTRAGDLVAALFGPSGNSRLTGAQRAARAWFSANGDRERAHTTGVWLRKPGRSGSDPVMVVRLDSGLLAQELGTNKELYLARLGHAGVRVSDIRFEVGKPAGTSSSGAGRSQRVAPPPLRELTPAEEKRVERATSGLPEGLRQSVTRAMRATMAREGRSKS